MLQLVGFDGDDTLWHSEGYYRQAGDAFAAIMGRYVDLGDQHVHASMLATEQRNLALFGYGAKGMALSMVETAIAICTKAIGRQVSSLKVSARVLIAALSLFAPASPSRTP